MNEVKALSSVYNDYMSKVLTSMPTTTTLVHVVRACVRQIL